MNNFQPRRPRLRLDPDSYRKLRIEVLERDGWRCQYCGGSDRLESTTFAREAEMTRRIAIATKISDTLDVEWTNQPFVVKRSAKPSLLSRAWYSFLISSKPLRSRLGLSGLRRPKN
jgi:hypothetical protein